MGTNPGRLVTAGATAVITHSVRRDKHADYEIWLSEIIPPAKASPGHLDLHIVRPIPGLTETYTIILRFDTEDNLRKWKTSETRTRLIAKVRPLLLTDDDFFISSGLDFWFYPDGAKTQVPVRWKQFLATWSVIYPLVLGVPFIVTPILRLLNLSENLLLSTLAVTGTVVFLVTYLIIPRYTRLIKRWLFT